MSNAGVQAYNGVSGKAAMWWGPTGKSIYWDTVLAPAYLPEQCCTTFWPQYSHGLHLAFCVVSDLVMESVFLILKR